MRTRSSFSLSEPFRARDVFHHDDGSARVPGTPGVGASARAAAARSSVLVAMSGGAGRSDPRCVAHDMSDDPGDADVDDAGFLADAPGLVRALLERCETSWRAEGGLRGGSVYVGACGAAMLYYKLATIQREVQGEASAEDANLAMFGRASAAMLRDAMAWARRGAAEFASRAAAPRRDPAARRPVSTFLEGEAGCLALTAAIAHALGDRAEVRRAVAALLAMRVDVEAAPGEECELMYGRAGYLHALLFARTRCRSNENEDEPALVPPEAFRGIVAQIVAEGVAGARRVVDESSTSTPTSTSTLIRTPGLSHAWRGKRYLGCAHGEAGILLTLVQCERELGWDGRDGCWDGCSGGEDAETRAGGETFPRSPSSLARDAVSALCASLFDDGNLPSSLSSSSGNKLVQWCHGAPGLLPLLALCVAHEGPSAPPARTLAAALRSAAEATWRRGLLRRKGPGLCHGAAGCGYALLSAYAATGDRRYLARARRFARWTATFADRLATTFADAPGSLFEGLAGAACFVADAVDPKNAWFPGCEV
jgi:hypothetical protein